jgi:hypothetical protein
MKHIFLDTNIFLHFKPFDQINWKSITGSDSYVILIAPTIVNELDKHKYSSNKRLSKRAKSMLTKIDGLMDKAQDFIQFIYSRPKDSTYDDFGLSRGDQDDSLLATILEYKVSNTDSDVVLITFDSGPRFKAKSLNIQSLKMPEDMLLPEEPDESEKQIKALQKENLELKNRIPKVALSFKNGETLLKQTVKPIFIDKRSFIDKALQNIQSKHTPAVKAPEVNNNNLYFNMGAISNAFNSITEEQINNYNLSLDRFYREYTMFLTEKYEHLDFLNHSIEIKLYLTNLGTAPAEDIDIYMHFPDGFELYDKRNLPKSPTEPEPPYKPKHAFDLGNFAMPSPIAPYREKRPNLDYELSPRIKKTNSYDVNYSFSGLKHNQLIELSKLVAHFDSIDAMRNFSIDYSIVIANHPKKIEGKLHVVFDRTDD